MGEFYFVPANHNAVDRRVLLERELHACATSSSSMDVLELIRMRASEDKALAELAKSETKLLEKRSPATSPQVPRKAAAAAAAAAAPTRGSAASLQVPGTSHSHA